jgi:hypothetical protein
MTTYFFQTQIFCLSNSKYLAGHYCLNPPLKKGDLKLPLPTICGLKTYLTLGIGFEIGSSILIIEAGVASDDSDCS